MVLCPSWTFLLTPEPDRTLSIRVYRKITHTDQYLYWDIHHHIGDNYSVINTVHHRTKRVNTIPELLRTEKEYLREVLAKCKHTPWAVKGMETKNFEQINTFNSSSNKKNNKNHKNNGKNTNNKSLGYIVIPDM